MLIRAAEMTDTERIAATHSASIKALCSEYYASQDIAGWTEVLSPDSYENAVKEKIMIVAEDEDEDDILGLGILDLERNEVAAIYIHPKVKGTGIGGRLLLELEDRASKHNVDQLRLCSTINALGFYQHHGYIREGTAFHNLPNGTRLECIRMHKFLPKRQNM